MKDSYIDLLVNNHKKLILYLNNFPLAVSLHNIS